MGTQYQRLTTPRAWGPEAIQADLACNLEAHHVISQVWLKLPDRIPEAPRSRSDRRVWPWQPKTDPDRHRPLCPQLRPSRRPLPCHGFGAWILLGASPNPKPIPNLEPPPKPKPASIPKLH